MNNGERILAWTKRMRLALEYADSVHKRYPPRDWRKNKDEEMDNCLDDGCVADVLCSDTGSGKCTE